MKLKVTDVVAMAWNDHRINAENDDVKIEITVKDTIHKENNLLKVVKGDEIELPFTVKAKKTKKSKAATAAQEEEE